jgi:hypothetical protein
MNRKEVTIDGCRYMVARSDASPAGFTRWNLKLWIPTFGKGGAFHQESFVLLPTTSTVDQASKRLLGE